MSLDTVVADIREEAEARAEEILATAESEAEEIRSEAEAEAEKIRTAAKEDVESKIEQEREQRLSSGQLEAKQNRLEARRDVLESVRDRVESELQSLPEAQRRELTRALLEDAETELSEAAVYANSADRDLVEDLLESYEGLELEGETDCLGGVVLEGHDGRIRIDNTFDSVLETVWDDHLKELSDVLFEEQ